MLPSDAEGRNGLCLFSLLASAQHSFNEVMLPMEMSMSQSETEPETVQVVAPCAMQAGKSNVS